MQIQWRGILVIGVLTALVIVGGCVFQSDWYLKSERIKGGAGMLYVCSFIMVAALLAAATYCVRYASRIHRLLEDGMNVVGFLGFVSVMTMIVCNHGREWALDSDGRWYSLTKQDDKGVMRFLNGVKVSESRLKSIEKGDDRQSAAPAVLLLFGIGFISIFNLFLKFVVGYSPPIRRR